MAKSKLKGVFIVVPAQFDTDAEAQGSVITLSSASKANAFCDDLQRWVKRYLSKEMGLSVKGLEKDDPKRKEILADIKALPTIGLDIVFQGVDANGDPVGEAMEFDQKRGANVADDEDDEEDAAE
jgi:hypothetical protein